MFRASCISTTHNANIASNAGTGGDSTITNMTKCTSGVGVDAGGTSISSNISGDSSDIKHECSMGIWDENISFSIK